MTAREQLLADAFLELTDTLVADFDVIDFLHVLAERSIELVDVSAAGIMLGDQRGGLRVLASSSEEVRLLELYELQDDEGPCLDCFRLGAPVGYPDLATMNTVWPTFTSRITALGFGCAQAIPLRLRNETIGAMNLFRTSPGLMSVEDQRLAQALADVATIGLMQERTIAAQELLAEQLQTALNGRVRLEQAKGVVAERAGVPMDQAFRLMRHHARSRGLRLADIASQVIDGSFDTTLLTTH